MSNTNICSHWPEGCPASLSLVFSSSVHTFVHTDFYEMYTHASTWKQSLIRGYTTGLQVIKCWDGEAMIDPAVLDIENSDIT